MQSWYWETWRYRAELVRLSARPSVSLSSLIHVYGSLFLWGTRARALISNKYNNHMLKLYLVHSQERKKRRRQRYNRHSGYFFKYVETKINVGFWRCLRSCECRIRNNTYWLYVMEYLLNFPSGLLVSWLRLVFKLSRIYFTVT